VAFTDGRVIGATLDRNGLRPGRWLETKDGWVVLGLETGVMDEPPENVKRKGRLQPGKLFLVDLEPGRIVDGRRGQARGRRPQAVRRVVRAGHRPPRRPAGRARAPDAGRAAARPPARVRLHAGGPEGLLAPTAAKAEEPIGSMGNDAALPCCRPPAAAVRYFKQLFAQVTNPPIDSDPRGDRA
jgi:glutamate synthase (NADPH/NADH) large chain/glutamate synthase (ferredoxin)